MKPAEPTGGISIASADHGVASSVAARSHHPAPRPISTPPDREPRRADLSRTAHGARRTPGDVLIPRSGWIDRRRTGAPADRAWQRAQRRGVRPSLLPSAWRVATVDVTEGTDASSTKFHDVG